MDGADLSAEAGTDPKSWVLYMQLGTCEHEGKELKKLWRLVVPVSGGHCGFLYDSNNGTLQVYFNGEFHGTAFVEGTGMKGLAVCPCVAIAGIEDNNRDIGFGQKRAVVIEQPRLPRGLVL